MKRTITTLLSLLLGSALFAQSTLTVTPNVGSTRGYEAIIIKGDFGAETGAVFFGEVGAPVVEQIDSVTLRVFTPPHTGGAVNIFLRTAEVWIDTGLAFTFKEGFPEEVYERLLLPVFLPPVDGAHGSIFATDFRVFTSAQESIGLPGLNDRCIITCPDFPSIGGGQEEANFEYTGRVKSPGAFFYVRNDRIADLVAQLRVHDISRSATNFGTAIPIVRDEEFRTDPVVLLGVPTDARFRNTLRIYAKHNPEVVIVIENDSTRVERRLQLREGDELFKPAYAEFTDFPTGVGPVRVTVSYVEPVLVDPAPEPEPIWAFISVTNNDTQHITVISPQR